MTYRNALSYPFGNLGSTPSILYARYSIFVFIAILSQLLFKYEEFYYFNDICFSSLLEKENIMYLGISFDVNIKISNSFTCQFTSFISYNNVFLS
jgi:hypothetical protein